MLRYWLSLAILATVLLFTAAGGKDRPSRLIHGTCRTYAITRTFTMTRSTSNDTCTFSLPAFQCGGFCDSESTYEQQKKKLKQDGDVYQLRDWDEKCRCCEPIASGTVNITIPANTLDCEENPDLKWDEEIVYKSVKWFDEVESFCTCRTCRGSNRLP